MRAEGLFQPEGRVEAGLPEAVTQPFHEDLQAMKRLVTNPKTDLFAKIPWGEGQTVLREAMLVADHTAHHLGQLIDVRRLLGIWKQ